MTARASAPATSGGKAAAGAATPLLEQFQNVVIGDDPPGRVFELRPCGCDCWYCPECCERKGYNLRARLIPVLKQFTGIMMLTLTIDPELFDSPKSSYLHVRKQRAISRLIRELFSRGYLHSRRYFWVVEFQRDTEQPHYHVLIDATRIPKPAIDLAWSRFRPRDAGPLADNRPVFGMTRFSKSRFKGGAEHAARYATKYLIKAPEHGWPSWVLEMGKELRVARYRGSRGFWGEVRAKAASRARRPRKNSRSYLERCGECGNSLNIFEVVESTDESSGEVIEGRQWISRVGAGRDVLDRLIGDERDGKSRLRMNARNAESCLGALAKAAGRPVSVLAMASSKRESFA